MTKKCADWCGRGCTKEEYDQAVVDADNLVALLGNTDAWEPRVWENMGWHYSAEAVSGDHASVSSHGFDPGYFAIVERWSADGATPKAALNAVLRIVRAERDKLTAYLEALSRTKGGIG